MSLTVNKSIEKCFIHLAPGRVEIGGPSQPRQLLVFTFTVVLCRVGVCSGSRMVLPGSVGDSRGDSRAVCVPGAGARVCCSAGTPQGAVSGVTLQCPGLHWSSP